MVAYCRGFINQVALEIVNFDFRNREHLFSVTLLAATLLSPMEWRTDSQLLQIITIGHYC
jgi:hypothetical protein